MECACLCSGSGLLSATARIFHRASKMTPVFMLSHSSAPPSGSGKKQTPHGRLTDMSPQHNKSIHLHISLYACAIIKSPTERPSASRRQGNPSCLSDSRWIRPRQDLVLTRAATTLLSLKTVVGTLQLLSSLLDHLFVHLHHLVLPRLASCLLPSSSLHHTSSSR